MSTPPEPADLKAKLEALLVLSQDFESYDLFDLDQFRQFVEAREVLLSDIQQFTSAPLVAELQAEVSAMVEAIQEVDDRVGYRLEQERAEQARALREMTQVKSVLGAYKFPSINTSSGVENQG